jgi:hypothetical protein
LRRSRCAAHWGQFLAPSKVRGEASVWARSVDLDAVVARPIRPCCAESPPLRQAPFRQFRCCMQALLRDGHDARFRDSYAPLPYCRVSQFLAASFARSGVHTGHGHWQVDSESRTHGFSPGRAADQEIPGPPNRDPDSRFRANRESGIPCFPIPAESGNDSPRIPRFPEKTGKSGESGIRFPK